MAAAIAFPSENEFEKIRALNLTVNSPETEIQARSYLTDIRKAGTRLTQDIAILKRPHLDFIQEVDKRAKPFKELLAERDQQLQRALLDYDRLKRAAAEAANQKIMQKYEKKVERVEEKAIAQGKPLPVVIPPQFVNEPPKTVELEGVKQTVVKRKAFRLKSSSPYNAEMNLRQVFEMVGKTSIDEWWPEGVPGPEHFYMNTVQIGKIVKAGGVVAGFEQFEEESISVRG